MRPIRLDCIVGARPNLIKVAPLLAELSREEIACRLIHTGQHYDHQMSGGFFTDLGIPAPDVELGVGSGTHGQQTGKALIALEECFQASRSDLVVVVGDVNSTLAGALAAVKLKIPVAHIEAGYRSFDRRMPEEVNRVLVDHMADVHFAPTADAMSNLIAEGIPPQKTHFVGNLMAETLLRHEKKIRVKAAYGRFELKEKGYALATVHRPENVDDPERLQEIVEGFSRLTIPVLFPVHPRTNAALDRWGFTRDLGANVIRTGPLSYFDMLSLVAGARLTLTDSGGLQEEACLLGSPCLTLRDNTERTVTILAGANRLVPCERGAIIEAAARAIDYFPPHHDWAAPDKWDCQVSQRIVGHLRDWWTRSDSGNSDVSASNKKVYKQPTIEEEVVVS